MAVFIYTGDESPTFPLYREMNKVNEEGELVYSKSELAIFDKCSQIIHEMIRTNDTSINIADIYRLGYSDGIHDKSIEGITTLKPEYKHYNGNSDKIIERTKEMRQHPTEDNVPHICNYCDYRHDGVSCNDDNEYYGFWGDKDCPNFKVGSCLKCEVYKKNNEFDDKLCGEANIFDYSSGRNNCSNYKESK